jgi:hypothetical protein
MDRIAFRRLVLAGQVHPYAMVSFLEGLLNEPKGSLSNRNPSGMLRDLAQDQRLIQMFGSAAELQMFIGGRHAFDDAVMRGARNLARKYPHLIGDTGRHTAEELAQNLMAGLTLVGNAEAAQGNIFRRTGLIVGKRGGRISGPSIERALISFTQDQGRALRTTRAPMQSLNAPLGDDSSMTFLDLVEEGQFSTNEIGDLMMQATNGLGLAYFDKCMKRKRLTQNQYEVWQVILMHPEVVDLTDKGWKMRGERICEHRARMFPGFQPGTNCKNTIRKPTQAVLKRLDECIEDTSFTRQVRQNADLLEEVAGRRASIRRVASAHLSRTANNHPLKVGDILYSSWGYDQTNIDFYEVLKVTKSMAIIHRIDSRIVRRDIPYDYVVPVPGKLSSRGKPLRKRVRPDGMVGISSYAVARPWDGKPKGKTTSGYGH